MKRTLMLICGSLWMGLSTMGFAQTGAKSAQPATVEQAAAVLDLTRMPLFPGTEGQWPRSMSQLTYEAATTVAKAYEFHKQELVKLKWKELPGLYTSESGASGTFERDGFRLTFSVNSIGDAGKVMVLLHQHGNVDLGQLPLPVDAKPFYSQPTQAMFLSEKSVAQTMEACQANFLKQGWQLYGDVPDCLYFRKNAVIVVAYISSAPAQMGKTMIQLHSELASVEIPAPAVTEEFRYTDAPTQVYFESQQSEGDVFKFYQTELAARNWKVTTDKPLDDGNVRELIFRNPAKDMLSLKIYEYEGKRIVRLEHSTGAEVARRDELAKAELAKRRTPTEPQPASKSGKLIIAIPAGAKDVQAEKDRITFSMATGKAKAVVAGWRKEYMDAGWKDVASVLEAPAGSVSLSKGDATLTITYIDAGVIPTEITVDSFGIELERSKGKNDK